MRLNHHMALSANCQPCRNVVKVFPTAPLVMDVCGRFPAPALWMLPQERVAQDAIQAHLSFHLF